MQVESGANMGLHRSTTCPSSDSDDMLLNTLLHTLEDKDCNGKGRCSKSLDTFRIKLRPLKWKEQMQQEFKQALVFLRVEYCR